MASDEIKPELLDEAFIRLLARELTGRDVPPSGESHRSQVDPPTQVESSAQVESPVPLEPPTQVAPPPPLEPTSIAPTQPLEPPPAQPKQDDIPLASLHDTVTPTENGTAPAPNPSPTASHGQAPPRAGGLGEGRWQMRVDQPGKASLVIPLSDVPITLGRHDSNSIVLNCDRVSRKHARIWLDIMGPRVDDTGSSNGILVNGTKVPAAYLQPEDEIRIGRTSVRVEYIGP